MTPRGERNHNPGNIRHGEPWLGLSPLQQDANFATFTAAFFGIRALCKTLLSYQRKHGKKTIEQILFRWAPPVENDTDAYINAVAAEVGVGAKDEIQLYGNPGLLTKLAKAIIRHENGRCVYSDDEILKAANAAIG